VGTTGGDREPLAFEARLELARAPSQIGIERPGSGIGTYLGQPSSGQGIGISPASGLAEWAPRNAAAA